MPIKISEQERIEQINAKQNIKFIRWDGEYKNAFTRALCRCDIDGFEWSATIHDLVNGGTGCPRCSGKYKYTAEEYIERINTKQNIKFVRWDGEFKSNRSKAICRCDVDGYEWSATINNLIDRNTGCPYCARYGKTEEQPAPNVTVEIPTDVKPAFDLLNW